LSASLPAFGWLSELHSGFAAVVPVCALCCAVLVAPLRAALVVALVPWVPCACEVRCLVVEVESVVVCAIAGVSAPSTAAARMLRVNFVMS
jgi:hypothetical protein